MIFELGFFSITHAHRVCVRSIRVTTCDNGRDRPSIFVCEWWGKITVVSGLKNASLQSIWLRSDIHCQYWKSIVYVMCTIDLQYWQWVSEPVLHFPTHARSGFFSTTYVHRDALAVRVTAPSGTVTRIAKRLKSWNKTNLTFNFLIIFFY